MIMQLVSKLVPAWPKLAWVAKFPHRADTITVYHGPCVETNERYCIEGVWAGDFADGDFDRTDLVFGTGIRLRGDKAIFVSSGTTADRLCYLCDKGWWCVANSLSALLAITDLSLLEDYPGYAKDIGTIVLGLDEYKRTIPTTASDVHLLYFNNLLFHDGRLTETQKPDSACAFKTFEDYYAFLVSTAEKLADNINDRQRSNGIHLLTTISSGYDAATTAVIAKHAGCRSAVTIKQSTSLWRGSDSGKHIADNLGLRCREFNRIFKRYSLEEAIWAATGQPRVLSWTLFDYPEPLCLLFTGCYGDIMWDRRQGSLPSPFAGVSLANGGIGEFRLFRGIFHCPVPYWAGRHRHELRKINCSEQMEPWTLHNNYDRPIARRIIEEAGIPRGTFAQRKKNTSHDEPFLWPYSPESQTRFRSYLRLSGIKAPGLITVRLFRWIAWLDNLFYGNVTRKLRLPDLAVRRRLAPDCTPLLFQWSNAELKKHYLEGLRSAGGSACMGEVG